VPTVSKARKFNRTCPSNWLKTKEHIVKVPTVYRNFKILGPMEEQGKKYPQ